MAQRLQRKKVHPWIASSTGGRKVGRKDELLAHLKDVLMRALSFFMTLLSSAAVLHARTFRISCLSLIDILVLAVVTRAAREAGGGGARTTQVEAPPRSALLNPQQGLSRPTYSPTIYAPSLFRRSSPKKNKKGLFTK